MNIITEINTASEPVLLPSRHKFLIIGCGLAGLAVAIGIRRAGHEVTILEKAAEITELGAGITLSPNATAVLKQWGILEAVKEKATVPHYASMRSYRDSAELSKQELGHSMEKTWGAPYMVIHRADLQGVLLKEVSMLRVTVRLDSYVVKLNFSEPSVELQNGEKHAADIILGADGERSACRDGLLKSSLLSRDAGDHVFRITARINDVLQHADLADLVDPPCVNLWVGPGSFVVTYALKRDNLLNIVLTRAHDPAQTVTHGPQRADVSEVREAFAAWDGRFQKLLDLAQGCSKWTLLETPAPASWTHADGKFTLLGDAAHAMLPWLGQGAAMAFEDAAILGTLFAKVQHASQLPDILFIYERLRKPRTMAVRVRNSAMRDPFEFVDGPLQQERDRQLRHQTPFDGFPNFLADPVLQEFLFGYDAFAKAENAWETYLRGEWPSTRGKWNAASRAV